MKTEERTYWLCGYIEYIPEDPWGFLTPVFQDDQGQCYRQVVDSDCPIHWEPLPDSYLTRMIRTRSNPKIEDPCFAIYGFKSSAGLFFANAKRMSRYLSESFLPSNKGGEDLVISFQKDWRSLEPASTLPDSIEIVLMEGPA